MKINKPKLNLIIDIIMFLVMMPIAGIGFLMKYVLVPGIKRNQIYGHDVDLSFLGFDRHQWGTLHLTLSLLFLVFLLLHIVFHWKQVVSIFKKMIDNRLWRYILTSATVMLSIIFLVVPWFVNPEISVGNSHRVFTNKKYMEYQVREKEFNEQGISRSVNANLSVNTNDSLKQLHKECENQEEIEIFGYMTLNDVTKKYNIPVNELETCIHIPKGHNNEKLGRLRKQYGFHLSELKKYIEKKRN